MYGVCVCVCVRVYVCVYQMQIYYLLKPVCMYVYVCVCVCMFVKCLLYAHVWCVQYVHNTTYICVYIMRDSVCVCVCLVSLSMTTTNFSSHSTCVIYTNSWIPQHCCTSASHARARSHAVQGVGRKSVSAPTTKDWLINGLRIQEFGARVYLVPRIHFIDNGSV